MLTIRGKRIPQRQMPNFAWQSDLLWYDCPIVSHVKLASGGDALVVLLERVAQADRWGLFPLSERSLKLLVAGRITLRQIFHTSSATHLFHTGATVNRFFRVTRIPAQYLPAADSYLFQRVQSAVARSYEGITTKPWLLA